MDNGITHKEVCDLVLECVNNCKENGFWSNNTDQLTDGELAEDLYYIAGAFDRDDISMDDIENAVRKMRGHF